MPEQTSNNTENIQGAPTNKSVESPQILIVDDDKFLLDMYATKFREHGFSVFSASSASEAINHLQAGQNTFSALLLDLVMPEMNGFEFLKHIREQNLVSSCKVIVLSNLGEQSDVEKAKQFSIDGYIVKASVTPSEVVEKVKKIINQK